jgi:hypothetical protein
MVRDMNGVEIHKGQRVRVHQDKGISCAIVVDTFDGSNPTSNAPGHWVDIERINGVEGMMSYILEVIGE